MLLLSNGGILAFHELEGNQSQRQSVVPGEWVIGPVIAFQQTIAAASRSREPGPLPDGWVLRHCATETGKTQSEGCSSVIRIRQVNRPPA